MFAVIIITKYYYNTMLYINVNHAPNGLQAHVFNRNKVSEYITSLPN
jgi:hypothetical protein